MVASKTMEYDSYNRIIRVSNPDAGNEVAGTYWYDDQGFRVRKLAKRHVAGEDRQVEVLYPSMYFGLERQRHADGSVIDNSNYSVNNIYLDGVRIAAVIPSGDARYYLTDQVDSVKVVADDNGQAVSRMEYMPYGETWFEEGDTNNAPKYNSQENGKINGVARDFYKENGKALVEGYYKNGKADGTWSVYDLEGDIIKQELIKEDKLIFTRNYKIVNEDLQRPKNIPKEAQYYKKYNSWAFYDKTKTINNYYTWYIDGEIQMVSTSTTYGILNGKTTTWDKNGKKLGEGLFVNGNEEGEWLIWSERETLEEKQLFNKGKIISREIIGAPKIPNGLPIEKVKWDLNKKMWFIYDKDTDITTWYFPDGREYKKKK
jgi:antitoxin component YwqK of YwqJK toxin-antitoxin module